MSDSTASPLIGRWRITEMALWDNNYLDMIEPAYILFKADGRGEFKFGCVDGSIDGTLYTDAAEFSWEGSDEMDEACGDGWAELDEDGTLRGEISFRDGDESAFKARRW